MKRTLEFVIDCGQENMDVRTFVRRYLGFSARILSIECVMGESILRTEQHFSPSPLWAKAEASHTAPWVYCPPFSLTPGI